MSRQVFSLPTGTAPEHSSRLATMPSLLRDFLLRRQRDPLGEGHPCTWLTLLIKVAPEVVVRTRLVTRLSSRWPHLDRYRRVRDLLPTPVADPSGEPFG
jgi:hypothetical protein